MTMLSHRTIEDLIKLGELEIEGFEQKHLQPASVDLTLGDQVVLPPGHPLWTPEDDEPITFTSWGMEPGEFVLGTTIQTIKLPNYLTARFEGKSTIGRTGLLTHITAGFVDPGFSGEITVELKNLSYVPITLVPGMRIGQVSFSRLTSPAVPYGDPRWGNHYQGQSGPTPPHTEGL